ncbi:MAG: putative oligopeptide ABC transporter permease protein [Acidimicrobiaceae bacterium]|jgi:peptide/nickel transport system permease protein|nr:MAG: putative oligopeptide ABC transporter permease protein [Acidimicrobiaceae bacterium]
MLRYILKRVALSLITLWLLVTIVFLMVSLLPSDIARNILGNTAPEASVIAFREEFGLTDPLLQQYGRLMKSLVTFDFGQSWSTKRPVWGMISAPLLRSTKLAALALILTTPISIAAGLIAAKYRDTRIDRAIVLTGLATSSIPEFVTGALLAVVFGVQLGWFESVATFPPGTSLIGQLDYLLLPASAMAIVYFGYIARMMRSGTIRALESDYTRTATMKGLTGGQVMWRHALRNSLAPTITVVSVQIGYLFGGIVGVELVYNYPGLSRVILDAVKDLDLPVLQVAVIIVGAIYMITTLLADLVIAWLNPRARLELGQQ